MDVTTNKCVSNGVCGYDGCVDDCDCNCDCDCDFDDYDDDCDCNCDFDDFDFDFDDFDFDDFDARDVGSDFYFALASPDHLPSFVWPEWQPMPTPSP